MDSFTAGHIISSLIKSPMSPECGEGLGKLSPNDWNFIAEQAVDHSVAPFIYPILKKNHEILVPDKIIEKFQRIYLANSALSLGIFRDLSNTSRILKENNIKMIVLKGAFLAWKVYSNPALRPMEDIDILVKKDDAVKSAKLLEEKAAYYPAKEYWLDALEKVHMHIPGMLKEGHIPIEFHWSINKPGASYEINTEELWECAVPAKFADFECLALCPEDMLLNICTHCAHDHLFGMGLMHLLDIKETAGNPEIKIDWAKLKSLCEKYAVQRYVFLMFFISKKLLGAAIPSEFLQQIKPPDFTDEIADIAIRQLFNRRGFENYKASFIGQIWSGKTFTGKLANLAEKVFPKKENLAATYATSPYSKKIYLYYPIRIKDIFSVYGRTAAGIFGGNPELRDAYIKGKAAKKLADWMKGK